MDGLAVSLTSGPRAESARPPLRVAVAGLGAIGMAVARALQKGVPGCTLAAAAARDLDAAAKRLATLDAKIPALPIERLAEVADLVVECAPAALLPQIVEPFLKAGKTAIVLSCGALLKHPELIEIARQGGGQIIVPTGALIGLDAVSAAAEGKVQAVRMITRKPVKGLLGAPYLEQHNIEIDGITAPKLVFKGSAREGAAGFPANVNVAAALSLAGIGPDATMLEIWADPALTRNTHRIEVEADSASFSMAIENVPSENPKTGRITALSVVACLRKLNAPLRVGT